MKRAFLVAAVIALAGVASVTPRVSRNALVPLEKLTDSKVAQVDVNIPADVLGYTRGVYLDGYGAVFTAEVDLNPIPAPSPFRPKYTDAEIAKLRDRKLDRIVVLKKRMVESMMVIAQGLDHIPGTEQVVLAVTIPYYPWEKSDGMPRQVLIQAPKSALRMGGPTLESALKVQEF